MISGDRWMVGVQPGLTEDEYDKFYKFYFPGGKRNNKALTTDVYGTEMSRITLEKAYEKSPNTDKTVWERYREKYYNNDYFGKGDVEILSMVELDKEIWNMYYNMMEKNEINQEVTEAWEYGVKPYLDAEISKNFSPKKFLEALRKKKEKQKEYDEFKKLPLIQKSIRGQANREYELKGELNKAIIELEKVRFRPIISKKYKEFLDTREWIMENGKETKKMYIVPEEIAGGILSHKPFKFLDGKKHEDILRELKNDNKFKRGGRRRTRGKLRAKSRVKSRKKRRKSRRKSKGRKRRRKKRTKRRR